jgi:CDP-paratose 2-epimerase
MITPGNVIIGGAGFIGANLAHRLLAQGETVRIFDNLSRAGVERNVEWLSELYGSRFEFRRGNVVDLGAVREAVAGAESVFHFAAQVAVTTSLIDPLHDFEVNARGTLNVLEAIRAMSKPAQLIFTSTNKVYGALEDIALERLRTRYEPSAESTRRHGVSEQRALDLYSPYGCSKGAADQYVIDYGRTFGLSTVVFRMSCIYGPRQFGTEDQGWLAHFLRCAIEGKPLVLYGDGLQVRDVLFVGDLVDAFLAARAGMPALCGAAYNIGGGPENTTSLVELLSTMQELFGQAPLIAHEAARTGDQKYYVSDVRRFSRATGWAPRTKLRDGLIKLHAWLTSLQPRPQSPSAVFAESQP